jgi:hypothetical protein
VQAACVAGEQESVTMHVDRAGLWIVPHGVV